MVTKTILQQGLYGLDRVKDYYKGKSFRFSDYKIGGHYENTEYVQDFVVHEEILYSCMVSNQGEIPQVNSLYWKRLFGADTLSVVVSPDSEKIDDVPILTSNPDGIKVEGLIDRLIRTFEYHHDQVNNTARYTITAVDGTIYEADFPGEYLLTNADYNKENTTLSLYFYDDKAGSRHKIDINLEIERDYGTTYIPSSGVIDRQHHYSGYIANSGGTVTLSVNTSKPCRFYVISTSNTTLKFSNNWINAGENIVVSDVPYKVNCSVEPITGNVYYEAELLEEEITKSTSRFLGIYNYPSYLNSVCGGDNTGYNLGIRAYNSSFEQTYENTDYYFGYNDNVLNNQDSFVTIPDMGGDSYGVYVAPIDSDYIGSIRLTALSSGDTKYDLYNPSIGMLTSHIGEKFKSGTAFVFWGSIYALASIGEHLDTTETTSLVLNVDVDTWLDLDSITNPFPNLNTASILIRRPSTNTYVTDELYSAQYAALVAAFPKATIREVDIDTYSTW